MDDLKKAGKYVSMLLRHHPEEAGVVLDEHGWTDVKDLIEKVSPKYPITEEILHQMAFAPDKQRYEFSEDGKRIRAVHGHSVNVDLGYEEVKPPEILFHGTATKYLDAIMAEGLKKQSRQFVHLSEYEEQAVAVGRRHGKLVLFMVMAGKMYENGFVFYKSVSGVWLTDHVPEEYLIKMTVNLTPYKEIDQGEESIYDHVQEGYTVPEKVIAYLQTTNPFCFSPGGYKHPFKKEAFLLGPYIYTDGNYIWDRDTWKYVVKYHVTLPQEFISHVMSEEGTKYLENFAKSEESWANTFERWKENGNFISFLPQKDGGPSLDDF